MVSCTFAVPILALKPLDLNNIPARLEPTLWMTGLDIAVLSNGLVQGAVVVLYYLQPGFPAGIRSYIFPRSDDTDHEYALAESFGVVKEWDFRATHSHPVLSIQGRFVWLPRSGDYSPAVSSTKDGDAAAVPPAVWSASGNAATATLWWVSSQRGTRSWYLLTGTGTGFHDFGNVVGDSRF